MLHIAAKKKVHFTRGNVIPSPGRKGYTVSSQLGKGAYGTVYLVSKGSHEYVMKVSTSREDVVLNETDMLKSIKSKCNPYLLCHVESYVISDPNEVFYYIIITDFIPNAKELTRGFYKKEVGRRIPKEVRLDMKCRLLYGLAQMHSMGVVHRDIKPGNIIYDSSSHKTRYIDFGFSCTTDDNCSVTAGTPPYFSAEKLDAYLERVLFTKQDEIYADWWALGVTFLDLDGVNPILKKVRSPPEKGRKGFLIGLRSLLNKYAESGRSFSEYFKLPKDEFTNVINTLLHSDPKKRVITKAQADILCEATKSMVSSASRPPKKSSRKSASASKSASYNSSLFSSSAGGGRQSSKKSKKSKKSKSRSRFCKGRKADGRPCRNRVTGRYKYCHHHRR
jgi:serine/threonine protein kinase